MMKLRSPLCLSLMAIYACTANSSLAQTVSVKDKSSLLCQSAAQAVEQYLSIPDGFLSAISRVETGRPNNQGTVSAWPWAINVNGKGYFFPTKDKAIEAVKSYQAQGLKSIDIGCFQVNIMHHPDAFSTLKDGFDPLINARYAGEFLLRMKNQTGSWPRAAAAYHSLIEAKSNNYLQNVLTQWGVPQEPHHQSDVSATTIYDTPNKTSEPLNKIASQEPPHGDQSQSSAVPPTKPHYTQFTLFHADKNGKITPIKPPNISPNNDQLALNNIPSSHGGGINHATSGNIHALETIRHHMIDMTLPSSGTGYAQRPFHPFKGFFKVFEPPPPHQRMKSSDNGRSLDSYRKMPVTTQAPMPQIQSY